MYISKTLAAVAASALLLTACSDDNNGGVSSPARSKYALSLGVTANGNTTYYVVKSNDLMTGTISAQGNGLEETGYHDYMQAANGNILSIGGLGVTDVNMISQDAQGVLSVRTMFRANTALSELCQADDKTLLGLEVPATPQAGSQLTFYVVDAVTGSVTNTNTSNAVAPLAQQEWPSVTGMSVNNGHVYVAYVPMSRETYATPATDSCYVAVFTYPGLQFEKLMKDARTGNAGSWNAYNAFQRDEQGDLYVMSNSNVANGFSQSTQDAAFLRIRKGQTEFDTNYLFPFGKQTGGLRPAHWLYVGNGLAYALVSTETDQSAENLRWSDRNLKAYVVDLYNQRATEVQGVPLHNGDGGRRFAALVEGNYVYHLVNDASGAYIYRTDVTSATARRGARVETSFMAGMFKF